MASSLGGKLALTLTVGFLFFAAGAEREVLGQETKPATGETGLVEALRQLFEEETKGFRNCPPPYSHVLGECFYIHMYIPLLTWKEAQTFCKQAGGILAEPKHFGAVVAQLYNTGMAEKIFRGIFNRLWVGGERVSPNSTEFKWTSGRPIEDPVSELDDPIYDDATGDCVMLTMYKDGPFELRAKDCKSKTHYVCQLP